ncbi:hypothetical protein [Microbulbifer discodermiae]|uniref:hypothetical protein n=1 Tax=Microbulbifer sp. 2201CG32-9 TaxID=3232309 RepID=UPI00345BF11F
MTKMTTMLCSLMLSGSLLLTAESATAQGGLFGLGADEANPTLTIDPIRIHLNIPVPVNGAKLYQLLAQAGGEGELSALRNAALARYRAQFDSEMQRHFREFFVDEEVPLTQTEALLTLRTIAQLTVVKNLVALESSDGYEVERGTIRLEGSVRIEIRDRADRSLFSRDIDVGRLRVKKDYTVKSAADGSNSEDTTDAAISEVLSEVARRLVRRADGDLEADELRDLLPATG